MFKPFRYLSKFPSFFREGRVERGYVNWTNKLESPIKLFLKTSDREPGAESAK